MENRPSSAGPSFTFYSSKIGHDDQTSDTNRQEMVYRKSGKHRDSWLQRETQKNNLLVKNAGGSEYTFLRQVSVNAFNDDENLRSLKQQNRKIYVEEGSYLHGYENIRERYSHTKRIRELENQEKKQTLQLSSVYDAAHFGDLSRIRELYKRYPDMINSRNERGYTVLHIASQAGQVEVIKWLAANNAILDAESNNGYTAMHVCAVKGNLECMRVLAAMGAHIDYVSGSDRQTPLHLAALKGHVECVKWLIANRANINIRDVREMTPKMLSEKYGHTEVTEFLVAIEQSLSDPKNVYTLLRTNSYSSKTLYHSQQEKEILSIEKALFASNFTSEYVLGSLVSTRSVNELFQPVDLRLPARPPFEIVEVIIHCPSGKKEQTTIRDGKDGSVTVRFQPTEPGLHKLYVIYGNNIRENHPILFIVNSVTTWNYNRAYGHGLSHGVTKEPAEFTIVTKDSCIDVPLHINFVREARSGAVPSELFKPDDVESRCEFCLNIPVNDRDIRADLIFAIDASGSVGKANFDKEIDFVSQFIQDYPLGKDQVQCSVLLFGTDVMNDFFLNEHYSKSDLVNAIEKTKDKYPKNNSTATAKALRFMREKTLLSENGVQKDVMKFILILTDGASSQPAETLKESTLLKKCDNVTVIAVGIGDNLKKEELFAMATGKELVFMSPTFDALKVVNEEIKKYTTGTWNIRMSSLNQRNDVPSASFNIKCTFPFDLKASVKSPSGADVKCDVNKIRSTQYSVDFVPSEAGVHKVYVADDKTPVPGSPFEFKIDPMVTKKPDIQTVSLINEKPDMKPYQFNVFGRPAGSGEITIIIEGPSKALLSYDKKQDGSCTVKYTVTEPGEYMVSIKCNNQHIPNSPFNARFTEKCSFVFCNCKIFRDS